MGLRPAHRAIRVVRTSAAIVLVCAFALITWYRGTYHAWPGMRASDEVSWCGRDYQYEGPPQTGRQVFSSLWPVRAEGTYPPLGGDELFAMTYPRGLTVSTSCAVVIYLRTGTDEYRPYSLDGGP
jgi:hypothetical protein